MDNVYIGVDVGSPNITIGAITDKGKIIKKKTVNLSRTIGDGVSFIDAIIESIYLFINDNGCQLKSYRHPRLVGERCVVGLVIV